MTREDSIRSKTWVTDDGRYLTVDEITDDHLHNIRLMLCAGITPGYDQTAGREIARARAARRENLLDYTIDGTWAELDQDMYAAAWLQIIDDELAQRQEDVA
jgi:hypothetical protein